MNRLKTIVCCVSIACLPYTDLSANPDGGTVISGSATFSQQGSTLHITNTPGTIINWQNFSIQSDETTRFIQQSADSAVLNRVIGQDPSQILGKLQSNGRVFIINPNGILFGQGSVVDVNGLVASSLNLSDADFLAQQLNFSGDANSAKIINQGAITTSEGGFVYLIAPDVENHGIITSPEGDVILAAGHSVQLVSSNDPDVRVTLTASESEALNVGEIITRAGKTSIYAGLIRQQGTVNADSAVIGKNGKIFFKSTKQTLLSSDSITSANGTQGGSVIIKSTQGLTEVAGVVSTKGSNDKGGDIQILGVHAGVIDNANIDASGSSGGGSVLIGGDNKGANPDIQNAKASYVGVNTNIHADANNEGDGGTIIVWSDEATRAYGNITAKGGITSGNGGYVETSGGYLDIAGLKLDVSAVNGKGGTWLLDPYNITISGTTTVNTSAGPTYIATATGSNIFNGDINTQLDAGVAVIVDTTGAGAENGDITVDAAITKTTGAATSLTLKAHNDIIINQTISASGSALAVNLVADQDTNNLGGVRINNQISSNGGNISITAYNDIKADVWVGTVPVLNAGAGDVSLTSSGGSILRFGNTDVFSNNLTLNAATGINGASYFVVNSNNITFNNSTSGFVNIYNQNTGTPTVSGTNSGGYVFYHGATNNSTIINNITANGLIGLRVNNPNITGVLNASANDIYLQSNTMGTSLSVNGSNTFNLTNSMLANLSANTVHIGFDGMYANYATTTDIASTAATSFGNYNVSLYGSTGFTAGSLGTTITSGNLNLRSNQVDILGTINNGTNTVYISPFNNNAISIDGSQTFNLTQGEITNISAGALVIGSDGTTTRATTASISTTASTTLGAIRTDITALNDITFGANNFTATGEVNFKSSTGNVTTGAGLVSSDILVLEAAGLITVGNGGLTTTNYSGLNGGDIMITGTVTSPIFYLSVYTPGSTLSVGGSQPYNIAQADIDFLNTTTTYIGNNPYVNNTSNIIMGTSAPIDFGARSVVLKSDNGMSFGSSTFKATGGNLTFTSVNTGFDIATGTGNVAANTLTFNSGRDVIIASGGLNASGAITLNATNSITQNGNILSSGAGANSFTATNANIVMAAGTSTTSTNANINYSAGGYVSLALLDSGTANSAISAGTNVIDTNGIGVNNINANNLTISSGGNANLDYQITGTLNASGVTGVPDLRIYPAAGGTSTAEPLLITLATVTNTTNTLTTDTTITSTGTNTAPLSDAAAATETDSTTTASGTTNNSTTEGEATDEATEVAATEEKTESQLIATKNLPICK